ncbi:hypothetical protein [Pseudoroseomonas ludipueritiae]|uniref:DUF2730 family protein n=1 Tax=Pseudoroseomonas ludipueritiae TaxID=198093 RepID=A0ABR7R3I2_9PROT|nr:hypothetical protein [Pseudoroseomonas ludipueritiae]MBC9176315.1 hypothetical protein [Pseudoroseomonas ludipueritiae]MCG7362221.1 hypothetical protein [Roseomonas sp. ACRSG]
MNPAEMEPQMLAAAVQAPMMAALFWMMHGLRRGLSERLPPLDDPPPSRDPDALARTRDELAAFKLEVARTYVPLSLIRDVDQRLTQQLLRIEEKLDAATRAATVAAAAVAAQQPQRGWRPEDRA